MFSTIILPVTLHGCESWFITESSKLIGSLTGRTSFRIQIFTAKWWVQLKELSQNGDMMGTVKGTFTKFSGAV